METGCNVPFLIMFIVVSIETHVSFSMCVRTRCHVKLSVTTWCMTFLLVNANVDMDAPSGLACGRERTSGKLAGHVCGPTEPA
jgi:hypothetical protein